MNDALGTALRALTRPTTPRELQERGVHRLRSIPLSEFTRMVEIALDQALREGRAELSDGERADLVMSAEGRLRTLLSTQRRLTDAAESRREALEEWQSREASAVDDDLAQVAALIDSAEGDSNQLASAVQGALERARERESLLERRIAKLLGAVEETEAALQSALACFDTTHKHRSHARPGLEQDDPRREQKLSMMKEVLRTNRGLRR